MTDSPAPDALETARRTLLDSGAGDLPTLPWQHPNEPPDDATLLRYALWRSNRQVGSVPRDELGSGLLLIEAARTYLDSLETALLFTARAEGWTWGEVAEALGVRSPQAAQQRYQRVSQRPDGA